MVGDESRGNVGPLDGERIEREIRDASQKVDKKLITPIVCSASVSIGSLSYLMFTYEPSNTWFSSNTAREYFEMRRAQNSAQRVLSDLSSRTNLTQNDSLLEISLEEVVRTTGEAMSIIEQDPIYESYIEQQSKDGVARNFGMVGTAVVIFSLLGMVYNRSKRLRKIRENRAIISQLAEDYKDPFLI